jgi:alpha-beta hydrolase superfamily lysophospholipase
MSPKKWLKALLVVAPAFILLTVAGMQLVRTHVLVHPPDWTVELDAAKAGCPVERVRFTSTDGIPLVGWFVPGAGGAPASGSGATIVASHGSHATGPGYYFSVAFLRDAGYNVFVFDHRAHGQSGGKTTTLGPLEVRDMRGAVAYLAARPDVDPRRIGAMGCSMGSAVSIGAAAEDTGIRAVVADSVFANAREVWERWGQVRVRGTRLRWSWGWLMRAGAWVMTGYPVGTFSPEELIGEISPRPVLLIHGEYDNGACTVADAKRLYQAAGEPKELWLVPKAWHCHAHTLLAEVYEERVRSFFDEALLE